MFSRKPIPTDCSFPVVSGAGASIRRCIATARCSDSRSLNCSVPVLLVWPTIVKQDARGRAFAGDQANPHRVLAADLRIREELERPRAIEKLDGEAVGREPELHDLRERLFGVIGASQLRVDEIEAVEHAHLLTLGPRGGRFVIAQRFLVVSGLVELRGLGDQRVDRDTR